MTNDDSCGDDDDHVDDHQNDQDDHLVIDEDVLEDGEAFAL